MAKTPEDIIELTDIIEHGPDAPKPDGAGGGVDLSFERELEDLFAEPSAPAPQNGELAGDGQDIDLDGLDALLAEAEKNGPAGADLPELTDDFLDPGSLGEAGSPDADLEALLGQDLSSASDDAADTDISFDAALGAAAATATAAMPEPAPAPAEQAAPSGQALEALSDRLDKLEEKLTGMGDTLAQSFKSMLDEALAAFKAELPEPAAAPAESVDMDAVDARIAEKLDEFKAAMPEPAEPAGAIDEEALAARIKDEIVSSLPEPAPAETALDMDALDALVAAKLDEFKAAMPEPAASIDEEALAARIKDEIVSSLPEPAPAEAALDMDAVYALVAAKLDEFKAAMPEPAEPAASIDEEALAARIKDDISATLMASSVSLDAVDERVAVKLDALKDTLPQAPDLSGYVTREDLEALRQELLAEVRKAVPAAAAKIIREEIQALVQDMD